MCIEVVRTQGDNLVALGCDDLEWSDWQFETNTISMKVVYGKDWSVQLFGEEPIQLHEGDVVTIPSGVKYKLLNGESSLVIRTREE